MKSRNTITTPEIHDLHIREKCGDAIYLGKDQTLSIHKAVEKIAQYFKTEGNFDFVMYTAVHDRTKKKCDAYIWLANDWECDHVIGAIVFRYKDDVGEKNKWTLEWVWIHPFYRARGLLTAAWPDFIKKYGDFDIESPLSYGMEAFLSRKVKNKNATY